MVKVRVRIRVTDRERVRVRVKVRVRVHSLVLVTIFLKRLHTNSDSNSDSSHNPNPNPYSSVLAAIFPPRLRAGLKNVALFQAQQRNLPGGEGRCGYPKEPAGRGGVKKREEGRGVRPSRSTLCHDPSSHKHLIPLPLTLLNL